MIRITFAEDVAGDIDEIYEYISRDNLEAADRQVQRLAKRWDQLRFQPRSGRARDDLNAGYRSITEGLYIIIYRIVSAEEVMIMRILQGNQDFSKIDFSGD